MLKIEVRRFEKSIKGVSKIIGSAAIAIGRNANAALPVRSHAMPASTDTTIATL